jgi:hypothetical protein
MCIPTPRRVAGEQEQQDCGPVKLHQLWWRMRRLFPYVACQLPMGCRYVKSAGWPSGANSASPEVELSLGTNSTSPEPRLGCLIYVNLAGDHSFNHASRIFESLNGLGHYLGQTSVSPEPGFGLDVSNGKASDITVNCRAYVLLQDFLPYSVLCQPIRHGQPPCQGGSGMWPSHRPWPRLSTEIGGLHQAKVNSKYNAMLQAIPFTGARLRLLTVRGQLRYSWRPSLGL